MALALLGALKCNAIRRMGIVYDSNFTHTCSKITNQVFVVVWVWKYQNKGSVGS